jgi:tetratricopeptide (TPR) repeat protein
MAIGSWLALVPGVAVIVGAALALRRVLREPSADWLMLAGLAFLVLFAFVLMSLKVPSVAQAKASYGLCALVPFAAFGAIGLDALAGWQKGRRLFVFSFFGLWAINSYATYWVRPGSAAVRILHTDALLKDGRRDEALDNLESLVRDDPQNVPARCMLVSQLLSARKEALQSNASDAKQTAPNWRSALQRIESQLQAQTDMLLKENPPAAEAQLTLAAVLADRDRFADAAIHARRAVELAPDHAGGYESLAVLLLNQGLYNQAADVAREGLRADAFRATLRFALGLGFLSAGNEPEANRQLKLAFALDPNIPDAPALLRKCLEKLGRTQ